ALGTASSVTISTLTSGTHTITAAATDSGDKTGRASITITVNSTPAVLITAPATGATFEPGAPVTFTGSASDTEDGDLSATIAWTSSRDGALGTGRTITASTLSTGTHTITATATDSGGKTAHTMITITVNATPVVAITAPTASTNDHAAANGVTATATDAADGNLASALIWTSSQDGFLGTSAHITVSTLSAGTHIIAASATDTAGKTGRATITVTINATPHVAITAPATGSNYEPGTAVTFTATATDAEDGNLAARISWISSRDGVLGTGGSITTSTLSSGTHAITASATDSRGKSASVAISVV